MSALTEALTYTARGWRVIPDPHGRKRPVMSGWPDRATTDAETIVQWWMADPGANVCIATGRASNLWVLDIDDKDDAGGSATLAALEREHSKLPLTYTVGTGSGGVHHYFTYEGVDFHLGNRVRKLGAGLSVLLIRVPFAALAGDAAGAGRGGEGRRDGQLPGVRESWTVGVERPCSATYCCSPACRKWAWRGRRTQQCGV